MGGDPAGRRDDRDRAGIGRHAAGLARAARPDLRGARALPRPRRLRSRVARAPAGAGEDPRPALHPLAVPPHPLRRSGQRGGRGGWRRGRGRGWTAGAPRAAVRSRHLAAAAHPARAAAAALRHAWPPGREVPRARRRAAVDASGGRRGGLRMSGRQGQDPAKAAGGAAPDAAPGDLFVVRELAEFEVEWAVVARDPRDPALLLVVPADAHPATGSADVRVPARSSDGPLNLRCAYAVRLPGSFFAADLRSGRLAAPDVSRAERRVDELERGVLRGEPLGQETDRDPDYQDWIADVVAPAAEALTAAARSGAPVRPRAAAPAGAFDRGHGARRVPGAGGRGPLLADRRLAARGRAPVAAALRRSRGRSVAGRRHPEHGLESRADQGRARRQPPAADGGARLGPSRGRHRPSRGAGSRRPSALAQPAAGAHARRRGPYRAATEPAAGADLPAGALSQRQHNALPAAHAEDREPSVTG